MFIQNCSVIDSLNFMIFDYYIIIHLSLLKKRLLNYSILVRLLVLEVFCSLFNRTNWKTSFKQLIFQQGWLLQITWRCMPGFSILKKAPPEKVSKLNYVKMSGTHVYLMHARQFQIISVLGPEDLWITLAFGGIPRDPKYMLRHLMLKISFVYVLKLFSAFSFS